MRGFNHRSQYQLTANVFVVQYAQNRLWLGFCLWTRREFRAYSWFSKKSPRNGRAEEEKREETSHQQSAKRWFSVYHVWADCNLDSNLTRQLYKYVIAEKTHQTRPNHNTITSGSLRQLAVHFMNLWTDILNWQRVRLDCDIRRYTNTDLPSSVTWAELTNEGGGPPSPGDLLQWAVAGAEGKGHTILWSVS